MAMEMEMEMEMLILLLLWQLKWSQLLEAMELHEVMVAAAAPPL